ncbi:hypothetical protein OESDEN_05225, partial [Oesophagostomum dentatum]
GCILCPNPDTSSAYNTGGESCRSNSITPDGSPNASNGQQQPTSPDETSASNQRSPRLLHRSKNMPLSPPTLRPESIVPTNTMKSGKKKSNETVDSRNRLHTPGYADVPSSSVESGTSSSRAVRRFLPLKIVPRKESDECAKRFRIPSLSIVTRDDKKKKSSEDAVLQQNLPMPKFFRSVKTKTKLYMFDKPVEEMTEGSDDHAGGGPSTSTLVAEQQPPQTSEAIIYKWKVRFSF